MASFDWDDDNVDHISTRHNVEPYEVEEAFADPDRLPISAHQGPMGERRSGIIGATEDGRVPTVVFTVRDERVRVVTARDATENEYHRYLRRVRRK